MGQTIESTVGLPRDRAKSNDEIVSRIFRRYTMANAGEYGSGSSGVLIGYSGSNDGPSGHLMDPQGKLPSVQEQWKSRFPAEQVLKKPCRHNQARKSGRNEKKAMFSAGHGKVHGTYTHHCPITKRMSKQLTPIKARSAIDATGPIIKLRCLSISNSTSRDSGVVDGQVIANPPRSTQARQAARSLLLLLEIFWKPHHEIEHESPLPSVARSESIYQNLTTITRTWCNG
ncbi:hypothetical protein AJ80_00605 [Polytolypa hystricis UAMH7299]|uniref:Uncharacterized protein n=1 Tax=Polytolypa hystricis (strain UAMH7299) TaxID=1447883 RepID=A0A2B7Z4Q3_POLH7|nr:hypothetical protein AJ80_00605 [Polytolypa hystricis UAMH7299]